MDETRMIKFKFSLGQKDYDAEWLWSDYMCLAYVLNSQSETSTFNQGLVKAQLIREGHISLCFANENVTFSEAEQIVKDQLLRQINIDYKTLCAESYPKLLENINSCELLKNKHVYAEQHDDKLYIAYDKSVLQELDSIIGDMCISSSEDGSVTLFAGRTSMTSSRGSVQDSDSAAESMSMDASLWATSDEADKEERPTQVIVSGVPPKVDEEYLEMFFENTKKHGGGTVANIELNDEDGVAIVEFEEPKAVEVILQRQRSKPIILAGVEIKVEAHAPQVPRNESDVLVGGEGVITKILVTKIPEKALHEEYLEMFFERNGGTVVSIQIFEDFSAAVVEFDKAEAVVTVMRKPLQMCKVGVEILPYNPTHVPRNIIEVRGQDMDSDMLEMYFESEKRSNGGAIQKLDLNDDGDVAYITFSSEKVAKRVVDMSSHSISKRQLLVKIYQPFDPLMDFLKHRCGFDKASQLQEVEDEHNNTKESKRVKQGCDENRQEDTEASIQTLPAFSQLPTQSMRQHLVETKTVTDTPPLCNFKIRKAFGKYLLEDNDKKTLRLPSTVKIGVHMELDNDLLKDEDGNIFQMKRNTAGKVIFMAVEEAGGGSGDSKEENEDLEQDSLQENYQVEPENKLDGQNSMTLSQRANARENSAPKDNEKRQSFNPGLLMDVIPALKLETARAESKDSVNLRYTSQTKKIEDGNNERVANSQTRDDIGAPSTALTDAKGKLETMAKMDLQPPTKAKDGVVSHTAAAVTSQGNLEATDTRVITSSEEYSMDVDTEMMNVFKPYHSPERQEVQPNTRAEDDVESPSTAVTSDNGQLRAIGKLGLQPKAIPEGDHGACFTSAAGAKGQLGTTGMLDQQPRARADIDAGPLSTAATTLQDKPMVMEKADIFSAMDYSDTEDMEVSLFDIMKTGHVPEVIQGPKRSGDNASDMEGAKQGQDGLPEKQSSLTASQLAKKSSKARPQRATEPTFQRVSSMEEFIELQTVLLHECKADVIVNSVHPNLMLGQGHVSKAILSAAGPEIQTEVLKKYPRGMKVWGIVSSKAYKLPHCKMVLHGALNTYHSAKSLEELENFVFKCLTITNKGNFKSIALPAVGTGNLRYPKPDVARVMFDAVVKFKNCTMRQGSLQKVVFVLFSGDQDTVKAFQKEQSRREATKALSRSLSEGKSRNKLTAQVSKNNWAENTDVDERYIAGRGYKDKHAREKPINVTDNAAKGSEITNAWGNESCVICMDYMTDPCAIPCGHKFCSDCLEQLKIYKPVCPTCSKPFGIIKGDQPDGTMREFVEKYKSCAGYEGYGTITIQYRFPSGLQKENHPVPGTRYEGIQRNAYLPDNRQGNIVLEMLKVAWNRNLVFTIGTSRTTGQEGVIWNDIHHKTNMTPYGKSGYPDPDYLHSVTEELGGKGVKEEDIPDYRLREINRRFPTRL